MFTTVQDAATYVRSNFKVPVIGGRIRGEDAAEIADTLFTMEMISEDMIRPLIRALKLGDNK